MADAPARRTRRVHRLAECGGDPQDGERERAHEPSSWRAQARRRKLTVRYSGVKHNIPRYACHRGLLDDGEPRCIGFGGLRVDDAIETALLEVVEPGAIAAAAEAEAEAAGRHDQARQAMLRDLEAARYEADRAFRQYDAADPENRLVAAELEARWNRALARFGEAEAKIAAHDGAAPART